MIIAYKYDGYKMTVIKYEEGPVKHRRQSYLIRGLMKNKTKVVITDKKYRLDLALWETAYKMWFLKMYKYRIFKNGRQKSFWRLWKLKRKRADYFVFKEFPQIEIGRGEFEAEYKGIKWLVPLNYKLNLDKP